MNLSRRVLSHNLPSDKLEFIEIKQGPSESVLPNTAIALRWCEIPVM